MPSTIFVSLVSSSFFFFFFSLVATCLITDEKEERGEGGGEERKKEREKHADKSWTRSRKNRNTEDQGNWVLRRGPWREDL